MGALVGCRESGRAGTSGAPAPPRRASRRPPPAAGPAGARHGEPASSTHVLQLQDALGTGQVQAELARQHRDPAQAVEVGVGVAAGAAGRPPRAHQPARLVDAQRLRMQAGQLGGDRDRVAGRPSCRALLEQPLAADRRGWRTGSPASFSSASRSCLESLLGTAMRTRASRSPAPAAVQRRGAAALHAQQLAVGRPGRHLDPDGRAVGRRQLHVRPHRRLGEGDRHVDHQVVAAALEERALGHPRDHVQVARLAAARRRLALALDLDPGAVLDARRAPAPGTSWSSARGRCRGRSGRDARSPSRHRRSGRRAG